MFTERKSNHVIDIKTAENHQLEQLNYLIKQIDTTLDILNDYTKLDVRLNPESREARKNNLCLKKSAVAAIILILQTLTYKGIQSIIELSQEQNDTPIGLLIFGYIYVSGYILCGIGSIPCTYFVYKKIKHTRGNEQVEVILASLSNLEKDPILQLLDTLEINRNEHTLQSLIDCLKQKKEEFIFQKGNGPRKTAFMLGTLPHLAGDSAIYTTFFKHPDYEKHNCDLIFQLAGFSDVPKKEKAENIKMLLQHSIFLTQPFDEHKDDEVLENILAYSGF